MKLGAGTLLSRYLPGVSMPTGMTGADCTRNSDIAEALRPRSHELQKGQRALVHRNRRGSKASHRRGTSTTFAALLSAGGERQIGSVAATERFIERVPGGTANTPALPGVYHEVLNEPERATLIDQFAQAMLSFRAGAQVRMEANPLGKLDDLRAQIDVIDDQILALLGQRAGTAREVAEAKRAAGFTSFYDPERERTMLEKLSKKGAGAFPESAIRSVFREIMSGAICRLQAPVSVAFLGPEATFSHMAARHLFGLAARYREATTTDGVFDAVRRGDALYGVVPVENSAEGSNNKTLDALLEGELLIRQELILEVSQCLLSRADGPHVDRSRLCEPSSVRPLPPVAREQPGQSRARDDGICLVGGSGSPRGWALGSGGKSVVGRVIGAPAAARAHRRSDRERDAVRGGGPRRCPAHGGRQDDFGLFLPDAGARGALKRVLDVFDQAGINLTRIESRPTGTKAWEYLFLVDIEGHRQEPTVSALIERLKAGCQVVKVLGSYPQFLPR